MTWQIQWEGQPLEVSGFSSQAEAHDHVCRHFLRRGECWEQLRPNPPPQAFRARREAKDEPEGDVLDDAARIYVALVERESSNARALTRFGFHKPHGNPHAGFYCYNVATPAGVFCGFRAARRGVSELVTAFRPIPARRGGSLTIQHFAAEARRRVLRDF